MKYKFKWCNVSVTIVVLSILFIPITHAQEATNPLSIFKDILPEPAKEIIDIANTAQKKMESKFGIDIEKMATGNVLPGINTAGSSQKITPEYGMNLLERVSELIGSTNPAEAPDFVGRATDIVRQFVKYVFSIMRQIVEMI